MSVSIAARWSYSGRQGRHPRLIVIHCTVSPEMGTGAEAVALYFSRLPATNKASAHKVVDDDSVVTCVADEDTAFGAAGANSDGLHLELVGLPTQTREEWQDKFSTHELALAQTVVDEWSTKFDIPLRWLTVAEVADGVTKGMCTHADVSAAFPKVSTGHWDPGPEFPKDLFPAPSPEEDDMPNELLQSISDDLHGVSAAVGRLDVAVNDAKTGIAARVADQANDLDGVSTEVSRLGEAIRDEKTGLVKKVDDIAARLDAIESKLK